MLETLQRIAQDIVRLRLHLVELFGGIAAARGCDHLKEPLAQRRVVAAFVLLQVARKPCADRTHRGQPIRPHQMKSL